MWVKYIYGYRNAIEWLHIVWGARVAQWVRSLDLTTHGSLSPIRRGLQKWCTRRAAASDKVYQLLAHGRWFSPGTPASSTTKTGRHDIDEILLKVALKHTQKKLNEPSTSWTENVDIKFVREKKQCCHKGKIKQAQQKLGWQKCSFKLPTAIKSHS